VLLNQGVKLDFSMREEYRLRVSENEFTRRIFGERKYEEY
jgi:hypothetical protein